MEYPEAELKKSDMPELSVRKAMKPLLQDIAKAEEVQQLVERGNADLRDVVRAELSKVIDSVMAVGDKVPAAPDLSAVATKADVAAAQPDLSIVKSVGEELQQAVSKAAEQAIAETTVLKELSAERQTKLIKSLQTIYDELHKRKDGTDPNNPRDYYNVRLTDGDSFYKALDKFVASITDTASPFVDSATGKTARPSVTNGKLDVNASVSSALYTTHLYSDATYTYICEANPGTSLSAASWRITRVDGSGNTDYAGGAVTFVNAATDLSTVQGYSYS